QNRRGSEEILPSPPPIPTTPQLLKPQTSPHRESRTTNSAPP
ncbi:hypothetical protein A2U01_0063997, partial [Trifolium medium]|nr:hypothetical protein [Trifolium medium]